MVPQYNFIPLTPYGRDVHFSNAHVTHADISTHPPVKGGTPEDTSAAVIAAFQPTRP